MTPLSPWEETLNPFVCRELRADLSLDCAFSPRPSTLGLGSKDQLTKQLSEESFSLADWGLPTVVSFLSYRPEIIQSTGFELQIREEEDDPGDGPVLYMGQGQKEQKGSAGGGKQGQVYGNWGGPS